MIELINLILSLFFLFLIIFIFQPKNIFVKNYNFSNFYHDHLLFSFIVFFNILFITSIMNINKNLIILIFIIFFFKYIISYIISKNIKKIKFDIFIFISTIFICTISISIDINASLPISWDSFKFWLSKANYFFNDYHFNEIGEYKNEYPPFFSYVLGFFWKYNLLQDVHIGLNSYLFIYIFSVIYFASQFDTHYFKKSLIALCFIFFTYNVSYFDGRQDIILFSLNLIIAALFNKIFFSKNLNLYYLYISAFVLNLILWCKTEGIVYFIIYSIILIYFSKFKLKDKLIFILFILFFFLLKYSIYYYYDISLNLNTEAYSEININLQKYFLNFFYTLKWSFFYLFRNLLLLFLIIIVLCDLKHLSQKSYLVILLTVSLIYLSILFGFTITEYPMPFHVIGALDRVLFHFSGFASIFLIINKKFQLFLR
jgi:hypothetical protein